MRGCDHQGESAEQSGYEKGLLSDRQRSEEMGKIYSRMSGCRWGGQDYGICRKV